MGDYCFRCVCLGSCLFIGCRGCAVPASERTVCAVGEKRRQTVFCVCECLKCQSKRFFQTDIRAIIRSTIRLIAAELGYEAGEQELTMLTQFYVGALVSIVEDWLLGEIQGTPEELIRFVDQVLQDHVRGAGLRLSQAGPGAAPLLEPDHCAGPVSK